MISQIRKRFDFNQSRGLIQQEAKSGMYDSTAETIWVLITFWIPQNMLKGNGRPSTPEEFKTMVWNQIYPFFTENGVQEYNQLIVPILRNGKV